MSSSQEPRTWTLQGNTPLRVKVRDHVLFLPASEPDIPTSTFFLLLDQGPAIDRGFAGSAQGGYTDFQPKQCSQSSLNSTQIFLLHPARPPWSAETSRRTACSPTSGTVFWREVQGQARSQRDAPGGPGYRDGRRWRGLSWEEFSVVL